MFSRSRILSKQTQTLFGKMLIFAVPIMAMNVLQLLFNAADMVVVGRYSGSTALAAVGATGSLINLIVNLFMGLSVGAAVVMARDYGAGQSEAIRRTVHTSIAVSIIAGVLVMITGLIVCQPLLGLMGTPEDIIHLSTFYLKIYFLGLPASMVYNFGAALLRAIGDSKRPMYFLTLSGSVNVLFNLFFVITLKAGVAGVAWATVISQYLAMALMLLSLSRSPGVLRFRYKHLRLDREKLVDIVKIGLPAGLQSLLFSISNVLIQSAVNSFGSIMVAASAAASNVEGFVSTAMNAYYNAAITFAGQSMGAKEYERIDAIARVSVILIFTTWIILSGTTVFFGEKLLGLYTKNPGVIELGLLRLKVMMAVYFTAGIMVVFPGLTRAMGYSILPMLCTLVGACLLRIAWLVLVFNRYPTVPVLFAAYPVTWALAGAGQVLSFLYARTAIRKKQELEKGAPAEVKL